MEKGQPMKLIDVSQAKATAETLLADPVLQWAVNAVLDNTPAVDAAPVVRCKDCEWYAPNHDGSWIGCAFDVRHPDDVPKANDFCSCGERKAQ